MSEYLDTLHHLSGWVSALGIDVLWHIDLLLIINYLTRLLSYFLVCSRWFSRSS